MTNPKQQVKSHFSELAREWAAHYSDLDPRSLGAQNLLSRRRFALEMVESVVPRGSTVLDIGCGTGEVAAKLMELGYEVWGVDVAEPMIFHAADRYGPDRFRVGDIEHIPFEDNTFDAVVCLGVIEYLATDEQALKEIRRVLKAGGSAVVSTPSSISPLHHIDRVFIRLMRTAQLHHLAKYRLRGRRSPVYQPHGLMTARRYYRSRWLRLLRSVGFEPEEWICHGWGWYRSTLGLVIAQSLSRGATFLRRPLERLFGPASHRRAKRWFVRSRSLNWLASEQIVRVRAVK